MKRKEMIELSFSFFKKDKARSIMTVIGIIIGITTITLVFGVSEGLLKNVEEQFSSFGNDKIIVLPYSSSSGMKLTGFGRRVGNKLYEGDAKAIKGINGVKSVSYLVWNRATVEFKKDKVDAAIYGINGDIIFKQWQDYLKIKEGRVLRNNDGYSVVLAYEAANELFSKKVKVGDRIKINGIEFRVVGILEKVGTGFSQTDDQAIYIPIDKARKIFGNLLLKDEVSFITIEASNEDLVESIKEEIERIIARRHSVPLDDKDFTVVTSKYVKETTNSILSTLSLASIVIAAIASIIGGIGISNTMFTSVMEKKKEIGIMRALGAKKRDVLLLFITESAIIGGIGSAIGLALSTVIGIILIMLKIPYSFNIGVYILSIIYGMAIGIIAGIIPAKNATNISPIEAMTYG